MEAPLEKIVFGIEPLDHVYYDDKFLKELENSGCKIAQELLKCYAQITKSITEIAPDQPKVLYDAGIVPWFTRKGYSIIETADYNMVLDGE